MFRTLAVAILSVALLAPAAGAQEVLITGFPLGVGGAADEAFYQPYASRLRDLADTLHRHPLARAIIVGTADGNTYDDDHDAKNPGLALGRAHAVRSILVERFGVDPTQLWIQSSDGKAKGEQFRSVHVRLDRALSDLQAAIEAVEPPPVAQAPPVVEQPPIEVIESNTYFYDNMALRIGGGASTSPFGALPMAGVAVIWKQTVALEALVGHTFWNESFAFEGNNLDTWQRMISGRVTYYPWQDKPVGFVGGWARFEEISQSYYEYARLSEGPLVGATVAPWKFLEVTGMYNPSRHRIADRDFSRAKNGQFLLSVSLHTHVGGGAR